MTTVRGTVTDQTGETIVGAVVRLTSQGGGADVTDVDGQFELSTHTASADTLLIQMSGRRTERIPFVPEGAVQSLGAIVLYEGEPELVPVLLIARAPANSATAVAMLERGNHNAVSAVANESIARQGDGDAATAVARMPGVSLADGGDINIRGLYGRYARSTLNGASLPGLNPDRRTVEMDLLPANLLDEILVYRSSTPDLPGDFTSGLVSVATLDFPAERTFRATASVGLNTGVHLRDAFLTHSGRGADRYAAGAHARAYAFDPSTLPTRAQVAAEEVSLQDVRTATLSLDDELVPTRGTPAPNHRFAISYGDRYRLNGRTLGVIASLTYDRRVTGYSDGKFGRFSVATAGAAGLDPIRRLSDASYADEVTAGGLVNASLRLDARNRISLTVLHNRSGAKTTRYREGSVSGATDERYRQRTLGYLQRAATSVHLRGAHALGSDGESWKFDWAVAGGHSRTDQPDLRLFGNFVGRDTSGAFPESFLGDAERHRPTRFSRALTVGHLNGRFDVTQEIAQWDGLPALFKFGAGYRYDARAFRETILRYENADRGDLGNLNAYVTEVNAVGGELAKRGVYIADDTEDGNQYDAHTALGHVYAMAEVPLAPRVKSVFGGRIETTRIALTSFREAYDLNDRRLVNDFDILPAASLIYGTADEATDVRVGYSRTLARPSIRELAPVRLYDDALDAYVLGDTSLELTRVDNVDLRVARYGSGVDKLSVGAFYKRFADPIELTIDPSASGLDLGYRNGGAGEVLGVELGIGKGLGAVVPGLSVVANTAIVASRVRIPAADLAAVRATGLATGDTRPLFGQSPFHLNASVVYEGPGGLRANVALDIQGRRLGFVGRGGTPDVYERRFSSLSAKLSVPVGARMRLSAEAGNLLDARRRWTQLYEGDEYVFWQFRPGRTAAAALSWQF